MGLFAQTYTDYLGAGHNNNITITTSHNENDAIGDNTLNGFGFMPDDKAASRFLAHATLGSDYETIQQLAQTGYSDWIDQQMALPTTSYFQKTDDIYQEAINLFIAQHGSGAVVGNEEIIPYASYFRMAWWDNIMKTNDLLRHRVTFALSEIFVVSQKSDLEDTGWGLGNYYDVLYNNAFGNYRDLLLEISLHPVMGFYLSHLSNPKSDPSVNQFPDENFAREIMQLFSIGLYELNPDGTRKVDGQGNFIPTYSHWEIANFAKIFTGLGASQTWAPWQPMNTGEPADFEANFVNDINLWSPMVMFEEWHEPGEKYLLNNLTVPSGQTGMQDINMAIDNLFYHDNVGPFIGYRLIQRLVKSNPSPEYVARITAVFNDNGQGVRGDLGAVVRAILLDPEARDCSWIDDPNSGKLREPLLRYTHLLRAFNASNQSGKFWNGAYYFEEVLKQHPLAAPSVFNFYLPDYQPNGPIVDANLVGPEFQIHNSSTSIGYVNMVDEWTFGYWVAEITTMASPEEPGELEESETDFAELNLSDELAIINNTNVLIDRLDLLLTHGMLSTHTRNVIFTAIDDVEEAEDKLNLALWLFMISPDYVVLK